MTNPDLISIDIPTHINQDCFDYDEHELVYHESESDLLIITDDEIERLR
jgi:hypothetical protein